MNILSAPKFRSTIVVLLSCLMLSACISTIVGAAVDTTIAVVKIPFKVGGAIIDAATPDDFSDENGSAIEEDKNKSEDQAVQMEAEVL